MAVSPEEYSRTCFVVMPYGVRKIGRETIDFDAIYSKLFKPAIQRVRVNGEERLSAHRADQGAHSRLLHGSMFHDLLGCRLALVDITGNNANVMMELGIRYAMLRSGTAVVRMKGTVIPFNLQDVSIREYRHRPPKEARSAVKLIAAVLRETLRCNEVDSPAYAAARAFLGRMGPPENPTEFGRTVIKAENYARAGDHRRAAELYAHVAELAPDLPLAHDRRGVLLRLAGDPMEAVAALRRARLLRSPGRAPAIEDLFATNIDEHIAKMLAKPKKLQIGSNIQKMLHAIGKGGDHISVQIDEKKGSNPEVTVISPTDVHWTGAVPQVLTGFGKVRQEGARVFPEEGYVASTYTIAMPKSGTSTVADLATGLDKLNELGPKVDVKIGGGGFGGGKVGGGGSGDF